MQRNTFEQIVDFDNLYEAFLLAQKGKHDHQQVVQFQANLMTELALIKWQLETRTYRVAKYWLFRISEPKERLIMALPFRDRVVQHALCNIIRPIMEKHFVAGNAANRNQRGTHYAIKLLTQQIGHLHRHYREQYCLKCDISGFFYNIDREILKRKLRLLPRIDEQTFWLIDVIIDSTPRIDTKNKGLPIGNLTSQFWAIYYLSALDHFIKESLRIKYYIRYMDDFTLLHPDKIYLKYCLEAIRDFLRADTGLELNNKTQIFSLAQGIDFLGWHFYQTESGKVVRLIRKDSKIRRRKRNKQWQRLYRNASTFEERRQIMAEGQRSLASWYGHAIHGHTYHLRERLSQELVLVSGEGDEMV